MRDVLCLCRNDSTTSCYTLQKWEMYVLYMEVILTHAHQLHLVYGSKHYIESCPFLCIIKNGALKNGLI